jgi:hypothetical protein
VAGGGCQPVRPALAGRVERGVAAGACRTGGLSRIAPVFTSKWDGRWQFTARDGCFRDNEGRGEAMVFSVTPVKVFAHAKGDPFGSTRHKF